MIRAVLLSMIATLLSATSLPTQSDPKIFHWEQGQILTYRVEQITAASETAENKTTETKTKLNLTKRWKILVVDQSGVATVELSLLALRLEQTKPDGGVLYAPYNSQNAAGERPRSSAATPAPARRRGHFR